MGRKPLVSAVIIFLNEEKFLEEAIRSVFAQTYDNWELLLVDDGSTDGTTAIGRRYARQYPEKVRYLEHKSHHNRGMSASRNLGIRHAKGEYIALLDADDVWLPHKLEQQLAVLSSYPEAAMVYGATLLWHSWTGRSEDIGRDLPQALGVQPNTLATPPELLRLYIARQAITPCPSDVLLHRNVVEDVGGFEDRFPGMYEDQVFFSKIALEAPIFVSAECWSKHRQHPNSNCTVWKTTGQYYSAAPNMAFLTWVHTYLASKGVYEPGIRRALRHRMWRYRHPLLFRFVRLARQYFTTT